jgi:ribonuclease E
MKKENAAQRREPSLFDDEYMAPAPAPVSEPTFAPEPVLAEEPVFTPEPMLAVEPSGDAEISRPADETPSRKPFKPLLWGGVGAVIVSLIGAIAWIGSTAGQQPKQAEVLKAPEGMAAKALPPPEISHPPAPQHVPSAIALPPGAEDGAAPAPPPAAPQAAAIAPTPAPEAARLVAPVAVAGGAALAPAAAAPAVRDEMRVARRAAPSGTKTAKAAKAKKAVKSATAKKTAKKTAKTATVKTARKAGAAKPARKASTVRCDARSKATAACRAKSQKTSKA